MKTNRKKPLPPMTVLFGLRIDAATSLTADSDTIIKLSHGWFELHFGKNVRLGEFLLVLTSSDSFLLSTKPPADAVIRKRRKQIDWVFSIQSLPQDFLGNPSRCTFLSYGGVSVMHGRDHDSRDFLSVALPARRLQLLFRDPDSHMTQAWNPRRAVPMSDGTEILAPVPARLCKTGKPSYESAGDAELDALLATLG